MRWCLRLLVSSVLAVPAWIGGAAAAPSPVTVAVPVSSAGNVSIVRVEIRAAIAASLPAVSLASNAALPAGAFVVAGVTRDPSPGRFHATVAVFTPSTPQGAPAPARAGSLALRLPPGYAVAGVRSVKDVLYENRVPGFPLETPASAVILGGAPPRMPAARMLQDAQRLALDLNVPVADMELLGYAYVSAEVSRVHGTSSSFVLVLGIAHLPQVNAVQLAFPHSVSVVGATAPGGTEVVKLQSALQLLASAGPFEEAVRYRFTFALDQPPSRGTSFTVRASTHYFENTLPFTERIFLSP
jgi:hypothetical protein